MSAKELGKSKFGDPSTGDDIHSEIMNVDAEPKHSGKRILRNDEQDSREKLLVDISHSDLNNFLNNLQQSAIKHVITSVGQNDDDRVLAEKSDPQDIIAALSAEVNRWKQEAKTKEQDLIDIREKHRKAQEQACLEDMEINKWRQEAERVWELLASTQGQLCRQAAHILVGERDRKSVEASAEVDQKESADQKSQSEEVDHKKSADQKLQSAKVDARKSGATPPLSLSQIMTTLNLEGKGDLNLIGTQPHAVSNITLMKQVAYEREQHLGSMKGKSLTAHQQASLKELEIVQMGEQAALKNMIAIIENSCRQRGAEYKDAQGMMAEFRREPGQFSEAQWKDIKALFNTLKTGQEDREANLKECKTLDYYFTNQRKLVKELLGSDGPQASTGGRPRSKKAGKR